MLRIVIKIGFESKQYLNHKNLRFKYPFNRIWNNWTYQYTIKFLEYNLIVYGMTGHPSIQPNRKNHNSKRPHSLDII